MVSTSDTGAVFYAATQWMPFAKFADVVAVLTLLDANGDATPDFTVTLAYQFATTRTSSPEGWAADIDTTNVLTDTADEVCAAWSITSGGTNRFWIRFGFKVINDSASENNRISARMLLTGTA